MSTIPPPNQRFPFAIHTETPDVQQAHIFAFNAIYDLQRANEVNVAKIKKLQSASSSSGTSTTTNTVTNTITIEDILSGLGAVNDQTGATAYTTQTSDAGALLILNDASPVSVSLNSVVTPPYALFVTNFGTGTATLTPTSGTINGGSSLALLQGQTIWVVFSGTNWKSGAFTAPPLDTPAVAHEFITAYNAATGAFTQAQPAYSDISGTPSPILSGTSSSIGGSPLIAGQVVSTTVTVTGATTGMAAVCSPVTYPGDGSAWDAYVSAANTVTVRLSAIIALTPAASAYNVRVIP